MTWTYSGDPGSSDRDELRFTIGDTDTTDQQLTDEELDFLLGRHTTVAKAAEAAVQVLISKYSRLVDQTTGDISQKYSQRVQAYKQLAKQLTAPGGLASITPTVYAGGISKADRETVEGDTDRDAPVFSVEITDNPSTLPDNLKGT